MDADEVAATIANWIREKVGEAGAEGVVVGLSGGVDSAVVTALAARALGQGVLGVIMPCQSRSEDADDALATAAALAVRTLTVPLDRPFSELLSVLPDGSDAAKANLKPRLRMAALYYCAGTLNYLVCGTGNRTEGQIGYFTKYGDGGADIMPIGGLLKCQVRQLASGLGIPEKILRKPPSAGLWAGQTDEGELGIIYEVLDGVIEALDKGLEPAAPAEMVAKVKALIKGAAHKKALPPICEVKLD